MIKVDLLGTFFVVFLVLKLAHIITWSWWLVTAPIWGYVVMVAVILTIVGIVQLGGWIYDKITGR